MLVNGSLDEAVETDLIEVHRNRQRISSSRVIATKSVEWYVQSEYDMQNSETRKITSGIKVG